MVYQKIALVLIILTFKNILYGQINLIPNGDFEENKFDNYYEVDSKKGVEKSLKFWQGAGALTLLINKSAKGENGLNYYYNKISPYEGFNCIGLSALSDSKGEKINLTSSGYIITRMRESLKPRCIYKLTFKYYTPYNILKNNNSDIVNSTFGVKFFNLSMEEYNQFYKQLDHNSYLTSCSNLNIAYGPGSENNWSTYSEYITVNDTLNYICLGFYPKSKVLKDEMYNGDYYYAMYIDNIELFK